MRIRIKSPTKDPRFLNQVPILSLVTLRVSFRGTPIEGVILTLIESFKVVLSVTLIVTLALILMEAIIVT